MRIHLGHHFYGAGNLGDDFMLAGFLAAMRALAPDATYTACVPFALEPLKARFPQIAWFAYNDANRKRCIAECDAWLGLGGSPFQSAQSRWFIDHLIGDAAFCGAEKRPMFYLGIGVQQHAELDQPEVRAVCDQARAIWTRDHASAAQLKHADTPAVAAADLAHVLFAQTPPPAAHAGRLTLVANFDYGTWPGMSRCLAAIDLLKPRERVWLAQESRELPGAERALFAALASNTQAKWNLALPDSPGAPLTEVISRWPSGEWLVTSRYHAALAGAWARSRIVVIVTNEKLRGAATELGLASMAPDATQSEVQAALDHSKIATAPVPLAERAVNACREFVAAVRAA